MFGESILIKSSMQLKVQEYLMEEKLDEKAKTTQAQYKHVLDLFFQNMPNEEITKLDLMNFKSLLIERYKPRTVSKYITIINKFIKYCELTDIDDDFDFTKLKKFYSKNALKNIKVQQKASLEDVIEPEEFKRMLRMAKKKDYEMYLIMQIFAYTGIRQAELSFFTVENIKSNYIEVKNKGKIRTIILRNDLRNELIQYCQANNISEGYIFQGQKPGTMLHPWTIYNRLKKIARLCRGINLKKIHAHSFRHLFAVKFLNDGGDLTELADILGHSSVDTTRIYTRTTDKMKKKKLENMRY